MDSGWMVWVGWGIWMVSGGYGWGVADIDDRRIRHIFLKWGIGANRRRYYTLYQLWPKQWISLCQYWFGCKLQIFSLFYLFFNPCLCFFNLFFKFSDYFSKYGIWNYREFLLYVPNHWMISVQLIHF